MSAQNPPTNSPVRSQESRRRCIFCGGPANSLEHAIPEWLSKRMGIRKLAFHPGHFSEGEGLKVRRLIKCKDLKTRQVCRECNHGWMGKLEEWALAHFGTCVTPDFPPEQFGQLKAVQSQPQQMIRWLLKTAIILELALPKGGMAKVVPALFPVAKGSVEPTDFHVWAAYTCERSFNFHVLRGFPVWNGGVLQPFQIHEGSMNFGLHLNHLALRLFRCPNARPYVVGNVTQLDGSYCMPLWLTQDVPCSFQHTHVYPTFQSFMEAMEVCADPPP